jgi:hypothetical protein
MHLALSDIVKAQGAVACGSAPLFQFAPFHAWLQLSLWLVCHIFFVIPHLARNLIARWARRHEHKSFSVFQIEPPALSFRNVNRARPVDLCSDEVDPRHRFRSLTATSFG